ncbi:acetate/propionate family kinase [Arcticibacterium luteifluviistationis]|uniref:Acetate kinase n=1 Tax=Arcticibacterium luteifluviistationis TaxID=1784714 RepID=A0A2Z4G7K3_9BACT|nr:acetate kinase [Arcticibacterium luteifluviistationis]AWV97137.1 acetate kinase [Arcticibacterium luteifluviistationis]
MNILVLNSGSSSIKYQLIQMPSEKVLCSGLLERVGHVDAQLSHNSIKGSCLLGKEIKDHKSGLKLIADLIVDKEVGAINNADEIAAVGHRVVHGGSKYGHTTQVTEEVKKEIKSLFSLAPLHNPGNLEGIEIAEQIFDKASQVVVFDTAFHQSIPEKAFKYAIPNKLLDEGIRLYGFHGTSHKYVAKKAEEYLGKIASKVITIHLGNGCSMTAIQNGKSIDHSMGFTPSAGLIMGTRSGDIDHSLIFYMVNTLGYDLDKVNHLLTKESGMLGLTGFMDLRDIQKSADFGDKNCILALEMNAYRIKKYIGSYAAAMNGLDAIIFTAGVGENSSILRAKICKDMDYLGIEINPETNHQKLDGLLDISSKTAKVKTLVIATNEELEIATQAYQLLSLK